MCQQLGDGALSAGALRWSSKVDWGAGSEFTNEFHRTGLFFQGFHHFLYQFEAKSSSSYLHQPGAPASVPELSTFSFGTYSEADIIHILRRMGFN